MNLQKIIYCLYCPKNKVPVYIGRTQKGIDRPWKHIEKKSHNKEVNKWVSYLAENNDKPVLLILDSAEEEKLLAAKEEFWIQKYFSEGFTLLNLTYITSGYFITLDSYKETDSLKYIRIYIRNKRKANNLSQKELSEKSGVGIRFIRELEQGNKTNFNTNSLQKLLELFGGTLTVNSFKE